MPQVSVPAITPDSHLKLHDLGFRADGDEWIVGRLDTGDFIAIPEIGVDAIRLFQSGNTPAEAGRKLAEATGEEIDLAPFAEGLAQEGLIATVDDQPVPGEQPRKPTFEWLKPHHVAWAQHWALPVALGAIILAGIIAVFLHPEVVPHSTEFVWSEYSSLTLLGTVLLGWTIIGLHETAHLITARAMGVPGRISLGTRLQFLVAQTNVTGIWLAPRRARITVYLAGMFVDLTWAALATFASIWLWPLEGLERLLPVVIMFGIFPLLFQVSVFMRTDLYFVLQDLTRCRNLYGDSGAYVRWHLARLRRSVSRLWKPATAQATLEPDPSLAIPPHERRIVRIYSGFMSTGILLSLAFFVFVSIPIIIAFYRQAIGNIASDETATRIDGIAGLLIFSFFQGLWFYAFIRQRRERRSSSVA